MKMSRCVIRAESLDRVIHIGVISIHMITKAEGIDISPKEKE